MFLKDLFSVADKQDLILKVGTSSNLILAVEVNSTEVDKSNGWRIHDVKKKTNKLRGDQKGQVTRKQLH